MRKTKAPLTANRVLGYRQVKLVRTGRRRRLVLDGLRFVAPAAGAVVVADGQVLDQSDPLGDAHVLLLRHLAERSTRQVYATGLEHVLQKGRGERGYQECLE